MSAIPQDSSVHPDYGYADADVPPPSGRSFGVTEIVDALRRGWRLPAYGLAAGVALGLCGYLLISAPYKSTARLLVDRSFSRFLQTNKIVDQPTFDEGEIGSQIYVMSSDSVLVPMIRALGLTSDSEFVGQGSDRGLIGSLKSMLTKLMGITPVSEAEREAGRELAAVDAVTKRLTVTREDAPNVMNVTFESKDRNKAADIANAIADSYLATTAAARLESTKAASQRLMDRLIELKKQSSAAERELQEFRVAHNLKSGTGGQEAEVRAQLTTQLTNAQIATAEAKGRLESIKQKKGEDIMAMVGADSLVNPTRNGAITFALTNSDLVRLRSQYRDIMARLHEIEARVGPKHAVTLKLRTQADLLTRTIESEERRIADAYQNEYEVAKAREAELAANIERLFGGTEDSNRLRQLESSVEALRTLYTTTMQKYNELNSLENQNVSDARIISRAVPPAGKSTKKNWAILGGCIFMGLGLGTVLAVGREWLADVFRTPKAVEAATEVRCTVLPQVAADNGPLNEYVLQSPYSRFAETLRNLKATIDGSRGPAAGGVVVGVVSALPGEGKTTLAANFAALTVASSASRTLVIDGDFHLRKLSAELAPDAREGLLEALEDPRRLPWLVRRRPSGIDVLPCVIPGRIPNAAELLGSSMMEQVLAVARKSYDYIIIEIAPVMGVVDVRQIERFIDSFVMVVEWGHTPRAAVVEALSEAEVIRDRLVGVVLNKADPLAMTTIAASRGVRTSAYVHA